MAARAGGFDVVVVGGGHNGLVAAGLLAKRGARVTVLERRSKVGGAAVTEQPWGPDFKMTALSYVMSMMPPRRPAPLPRATRSSCSGSVPAYASRTPTPVATGAAMLRPMKRTPTRLPTATLLTRRIVSDR